MARTQFPSKERLEALDAEVEEACPHPAGRDNHRFLRLFGYDDPLVVRVSGSGKRTPLRRRQFIERFCMIRTKRDELLPLVMNAPQRLLEAAQIRQERARRPVRQVVLKARQVGYSTIIEGYVVERTVRRRRTKAMIVAHDDETSGEVLQMAHLMKDEMPRGKGKKWKWRMKHGATYHIAFGDPIGGQIKIASAQKKHPGRGFTMSFLHASEVAFWPDAELKAQSLLNVLLDRAGTYCFMESTANGDTGFFFDTFWKAWEQRDVPIARRETMWNAIFIPWFALDEYAWSKTFGDGQELPADIALGILNTLTKHEAWLLEQKRFRRWRPDDEWEEVERNGARVWRRKHVGWQPVTLDQLAWRRRIIEDKMGGKALDPDSWKGFQAEFPATPEEAFQATGQQTFNRKLIQDAIERTYAPDFVGDLVDLADDPTANTQEQVEVAARESKISVEVLHGGG